LRKGSAHVGEPVTTQPRGGKRAGTAGAEHPQSHILVQLEIWGNFSSFGREKKGAAGRRISASLAPSRRPCAVLRVSQRPRPALSSKENKQNRSLKKQHHHQQKQQQQQNPKQKNRSPNRYERVTSDCLNPDSRRSLNAGGKLISQPSEDFKSLPWEDLADFNLLCA